jgi:hypothetical protein
MRELNAAPPGKEPNGVLEALPPHTRTPLCELYPSCRHQRRRLWWHVPLARRLGSGTDVQFGEMARVRVVASGHVRAVIAKALVPVCGGRMSATRHSAGYSRKLGGGATCANEQGTQENEGPPCSCRASTPGYHDAPSALGTGPCTLRD